jgi:hypothetical protein
MAPRLIARSFAFLQPGGERRRRKASETDRDLARNTENCSSIRIGRISATLLGSRAQSPASFRTGGEADTDSAAGDAQAGEADGGHAKAPARTGGERTLVREPKAAAGNAGVIVRCAAGGRLAQLVRALP